MKPLQREHKIDVMRGVAVLAVVLLHTQNAWYLGAGSDLAVEDRLRMRDTWLGMLSVPFSFGFLGLNLFFILSGMCIHLWMLKREQACAQWKFAFVPYMKRRMTRIYPAYAAAICFSLLCVALAEWIRIDLLGFSTVSTFATGLVEQTLRYLTFTHTLKHETFGGYNIPFYTMAIEFHMYLLYPVVLWGFRKFGSTATLGASIVHSAAWTVAVVLVDEEPFRRLVMDSVLVRWPEWIAGCLLAEQWWGRRRGILEVLRPRTVWLLAFACEGLAAFVQIRLGVTLNLLWSAGVLLLVSIYIVPSQRPETVWEKRLFHVGLFSYSIYLIHYPILRICAILLPPTPGRLLVHLGIYVLVLGGILVFAYRFFKAFEAPFLFRPTAHPGQRTGALP